MTNIPVKKGTYFGFEVKSYLTRTFREEAETMSSLCKRDGEPEWNADS
jgi:hypothetical protein